MCKELLTNAPILAYPDFTKPFKLTTDASNVAIGGVLSQSNRPLAYYSRTLNSAERNYSTIEKELLAILDCVKHFRPYLFGQKFVIETDHNPLVWLYKIKEPTSRLITWKLKLEEFDFTIVYKKGKENRVADALSRIEINNLEDDASVTPNCEDIPNISDEDVRQIIDSTRTLTTQADLSDRPDDPEDPLKETLETIHSTDEDNGKVIPISEQAVNTFSNRINLNIGEQSRCTLRKPFNKCTYNLCVRRNFIQEDLKQMLRKTIKANNTYGIYFKDQTLRKP